jgi:beta-exotoxin I transport system permease protein
MNRALWIKSLLEARLLLLALAVLLFAFNWIFVWISSMIELGPFGVFLQTLPPSFEKLSGVPFTSVATSLGRISMAYVDPVVVFAATIWGIGRGSDAVSGEIGRGTMEMLLAQPVRRISVLATQAAVTIGGAALLALAAWLGTCAGVATVKLDDQVSMTAFLPGVVNLFALMLFLAGFSTMVSSWDNYRWRTIGVVGGFYVVELVIKVVARLVAKLEWLMQFTFLGAFEPQALIIDPRQAWAVSLKYDGALVGLGLASYLVAAVVFCNRDLPAPL